MPKIYRYLGIIFYFFSKEHEPVHVHARYAGMESRVEFVIIEGKFVNFKVKKIKGKKPLKPAQIKEVKKFVHLYSKQITQKWIDCFVYGKKPEFEEINIQL